MYHSLVKSVVYLNDRGRGDGSDSESAQLQKHNYSWDFNGIDIITVGTCT